jgi:ATP-dependent DNA helicase PIF1
LLKVTVVSQGAHYGNSHCIPRIALYPNDSKTPFQFKRLQFPVRLAFAMSINKSQGQTLDKVGLYIPVPLFAHGHLYVALSRTRSGASGIVLYDPRDDEPQLTNVVFTEVFST